MNKDIFSREKELFLPVYNRIPLEIERGEGVHLIDKKGNRYLDFISGLGVNALGYSHPEIISAVTRQLNKFAHLSNNFITGVQVEFTEMLLKYSGMDYAFLTNSGAEAIEGAIKLIRKVKGPGKIIYSLTGSFHGRTYGAVTLTAKEKYKAGFEPMLPNIDHIKFNDLHDLSSKINENTAAIFLEFIQGEGGVNLVSDQFVSELLSLRDKFNFIIVSDSIQCGIGRSGKPYSFMYYDIKPDIICTAKAIGGGFPLGAFLTSGEFKDVFESGTHGTTFGGNPVSCAAGKAVLKEVFENGLMEKVKDNGAYFMEQLSEIRKMFPSKIKQVRGRGFMLGIELSFDGKKIVEELLNKRVLINLTNINVLRILPPLIAEKNDIDFFLYNFHETLKKLN
jgi:acetylornithine/N-succinyldiaminopimelate aminotransferase